MVRRLATAVARMSVLLAACAGPAMPEAAGPAPASGFPALRRAVAPRIALAVEDEASRDRAGEAERVFELTGLGPGMRVADVGTGDGYYAVRAARRVGIAGTVIAVDDDPASLDYVQRRLDAARLPTVRTVLGTADDPRLPPASVDLAIVAHRYAGIRNPYAYFWRLGGALASGGRLVIVDRPRAVQLQGILPDLVRCELGALGYRERAYLPLVAAGGYALVFERPERFPAPDTIRPCG